MISLKLHKKYFQDVSEGKKTFEIRKNDRQYAVGEELKLSEWDGEKYTGRYVDTVISYILTDDDFPEGLKTNYCILGLKYITTTNIPALAEPLCDIDITEK